jgi:hypothetical protein
MSRAYRIAVSGSVERIVHIDDGVCSSLELLPIVSRERTSELLAAELAKRGFTQKGDSAERAMEDGVTVEVELATGTVTVRIGKELALDVKGEKAAVLPLDPSAVAEIAEAQRDLQTKLDTWLDEKAEDQAEAARRELTKLLEGKLKDLKRELDGVVNRVTAEALKEKARSMGEIEELVEDEATGALTIKVRL